MILVPSAARTEGTGTKELPARFSAIAGVFLLNVTAAATEVGDTLDVYLQHSVDGGTTWNDFVHFTQVLGNGGAKKFEAVWNALMAPETELAAPGDAALAAGVKQGPIGDKIRAKWVVVEANANANASFTFSVHANLVRSY